MSGAHGSGKTRTIKVDYLARVEGEGALYIRFRDEVVQDVQLRIFEPPRFFEAFLRERDFKEVPDITARICGICPVAYQMSAVHAMENLLGLSVEGTLRDLRRLLYCGEWIESHVLHIYMLHAPDFLGYEDAIRMAKDHPEVVKRGLRLKKHGNELVTRVGGREIHPINVKVGGFYKLPSRSALLELLPDLQWGLEAAIETVRWVATLSFPDFERDYELVSLRHPSEYPMNEGRIHSSAGLDISAAEYDLHFEERHASHSTALHSVLKARGAYFVGPMARYNLNFDQLSPRIQALAEEVGAAPPILNPFRSIIIRALEVVHAYEEALRIIQAYSPTAPPALAVQPRSGTGYAATEAPRGLLYHRYTLDDAGLIQDARIVPPTSQNQLSIEQDLRSFVATRSALSDEALTWQCEQAVRNYDPCISCSTHFLKLDIRRERSSQPFDEG